jgi:DNA anti-recombination protein RmuC
VSTWLGHLDRVGSALAGAVAAYNKAVGSWTSRVGPHLSRITAATADEESLELEPVEEAVRELPDDGLRVVV